MSKLHQALLERSLRGTPAGADALIARVNSELTDAVLLGAPPRKQRPSVVAAVAAVVVVVGVGVPLLVFGRGGGDVADTSTTSLGPATTQTSAGPTTTVAEGTTLAPPTSLTDSTTGATATTVADGPVGASSVLTGDGWTRLTFPGLMPAWISDLVAVGDRVVAAGSATPECWSSTEGKGWSTCRSAVWVSQDRGRSWTAVALGENGDDVLAVETTDSGFIAVGGTFIGGHHGVVWTSTDGVTWERRTDPTFEGAQLLDVATGPGGLVVSGRWLEGDAFSAAVWSSPDGRTWHGPVILGPSGSLGGWPISQEPSTAANDTGSLAAVGVEVWSSGDGEVWEEAGAVEGTLIDDGEPRVRASSRGFALARLDFRLAPGPAVAYSTDGTTWTPVTLDDCTPEGLADIAADDDGFVAVGACRATDRVAVWTGSGEGAWRLVSTDDSLFGGVPKAVHVDEHGIIVIGDDVVWISNGDTSSHDEE